LRSRITLCIAKTIGVLLDDEDITVGLDFCLGMVTRGVRVGVLILVPRAAFVGDVVEATVSVVTIRDVDCIIIINVNRGVATNQIC
jgi:hypothetical protein